MLFRLLCFPPHVFNQLSNQTLLSDTENAYNPVPSPDGSMIAYVRTGRWEKGSGGMGRSNLRSQIMVMDSRGHILTKEPLADAFLAGWAPDGKSLVCYRDHDYFLVLLDGKKTKEIKVPFTVGRSEHNAERGAYLPSIASMVFVKHIFSGNGPSDAIYTAGKQLARNTDRLGEMLVPSPDGRYIAAVDDQFADGNLWVYDTQNDSWTNLGSITIHPKISFAGFGNNDWEWMKATWSPWFPDSSRLALIQDSSIVISTPDGKTKQVVTKLTDKAGLPTPSPDGKLIAYVTFDAKLHETQPHWTFWGNTIVWVVPTVPAAKSRAVTNKSSETTYCLRWLNRNTIVFDRFDEGIPFLSHHRLWSATVD